MDSNVQIAAPVVGDIGSCVSALLAGMGSNWAKPPADWTGTVASRREKNLAKMAETLALDPSPMNFHSALNVVRDIVKARSALAGLEGDYSAHSLRSGEVDSLPRRAMPAWRCRTSWRSEPVRELTKLELLASGTRQHVPARHRTLHAGILSNARAFKRLELTAMLVQAARGTQLPVSLARQDSPSWLKRLGSFGIRPILRNYSGSILGTSVKI